MQASSSLVRKSVPRALRCANGVRCLSSSPPATSATVSDPSQYNRTVEEKRKMNHNGKDSEYVLGKHRSNALDLVNKIAPIEVDGEMAICDGGGGGLGHPTEYISLQRPGAVEACKYCALRFTQKKK